MVKIKGCVGPITMDLSMELTIVSSSPTHSGVINRLFLLRSMIGSVLGRHIETFEECSKPSAKGTPQL